MDNNMGMEIENQRISINKLLTEIINCKDNSDLQKLVIKAIKELHALLDKIDIVEYLLIESSPIISKDEYINYYFNLSTLYKNYAELQIKNNKNLDSSIKKFSLNLFYKSIDYFRHLLRVNIEDSLALKQIVSIYSQIVYLFKDDPEQCIKFLHEGLFHVPDSEVLHYNIAFIYKQLNKLELAIYHYKLSISLLKGQNIDNESKLLLLNNYNGLSNVYSSVKDWPTSLYYLKKAEEINNTDPDIQNQLGVVYTEMRRTDLAEIAYNKAITNYKNINISSDPNTLLANIYLNYGHMFSYNGDNFSSIEAYNKSLKIEPKFNLPFQNKLMNLSYIFNELDDKMYITNQHKLINKVFTKVNKKYNFEKLKKESKINVGVISGDFVGHPVSYFISTFLKNYDPDIFNVFCYSECIINTSEFNKNINFIFIKNKSAQMVADIIYSHNIHILFDLAGHTAFNRLDVFALKPAVCQVSYIGYPFTTGLNEMDFRITDSICDKNDVSQKFYTEKLLYLNNCFLCYDPCPITENDKNYILPRLPEIQPYIKNNGKYLTIACFNRLNKITDGVIAVFNNILTKIPNVKFVFKTKALINKNISNGFKSKFDKSVVDRLIIYDCTNTYEQHLLTYNDIDIAIDTFPYSGTTTSCEALLMGVPVFTLYDSEYYFHPQNVTASILKNSDLSFYIVNNQEELIKKVNELHNKDILFWNSLKNNTRKAFLEGKVCNKKEYIYNFTELLKSIVKTVN